MKKSLLALALTFGLVGALNAQDILALVTKGALSDNSKGVKVLSLDEMKQVKGGYLVGFKVYKDKFNLTSELYAIGLISNEEAKTYPYNFKGLCGPGEEKCGYHSMNRFTEWGQIVSGDYNNYYPAYIVKRQIKASGLGRPYVLFSYEAGMLDSKGQIHKFNSSGMLNNNMVIREMAYKYKEAMESALGGYNTNAF